MEKPPRAFAEIIRANGGNSFKAERVCELERISKLLQAIALVLALLAPWVYFVGYAQDLGYLDSFKIESQMFFKAPQEYFGIAYVVILDAVATVLVSVPPKALYVLISVSVAIFVILYLVHKYHLWPKIYLWLTGFLWRRRGIVGKPFLKSFVPAYFLVSVPVLLWAAIAYLMLFLIIPPWIGYSNGQKEAKRIQQEWQSDSCALVHPKVGCTQIMEGKKAIASGKLIAASDKFAAIYDGATTRIYSLRNRDIRTVLLQKTKVENRE